MMFLQLEKENGLENKMSSSNAKAPPTMYAGGALLQLII